MIFTEVFAQGFKGMWILKTLESKMFEEDKQNECVEN